MNVAWVLIIVLLIVLLMGGPYTGWHSLGWGPSGIVGVILVVVIVLMLMGRL
jgi:hypothetical protein